MSIIDSKALPCLSIAYISSVSSISSVSPTVNLSIFSLPSIFSCNVLISLILTLVRKTFVIEFLSSLVLALSLSLNVSWQGRHLSRKDYLTQAIFKRVYSTADFIALVQEHARHLISSQLQLLVLTRPV